MYERTSISDHVRDSVRPVGFVDDESVLLPFLARREAIHFHFKTNCNQSFCKQCKSVRRLICNKGGGVFWALVDSICHRNRGGELGRGPKPPDLRPASNHVAD